jgi:diadenosine tetraphosphate (Ap4A) HIT family hydrolase
MDCKICKDIKESRDSYLLETDHWLIRHSHETNLEGYLILEARRHIVDLSQATDDEIASFGPMVALATRTIRRVVSPEKVYTFTLAESVAHLHMHLIPRSKDMPRAWTGRGIMSYPLTPAVNPATLPQVCERLRRELQRQKVLG